MSPGASGRLPRAYLFVPADRPERYAKACASGADAVIIDLEGAVAPAGKSRARDALANALDTRTPLVVRINAAGTPWFDEDVELCRHPGVAAVMLPKADGIDAPCSVVERCFKDVLATIESARGVEEARNIARVPGVIRLAFGTVDLAFDLGIDCHPGGGEHELLHFRSQVVLASRLAGLAAPVDGASTASDDVVQLRADCERARRLGFGAKLCLHLRQVAAVQAAFTPNPERVTWARHVCAAFAAAGGSEVAVDGQMIDKPLYERAQAILRIAGGGG